MSSGAFHNLQPSQLPGCDGHFLLRSGILMVEEPKTATEIARMIKEQAYIQLGPWPVDLQLIIFSTALGWRCGLSPATQTSGDASYRDAQPLLWSVKGLPIPTRKTRRRSSSHSIFAAGHQPAAAIASLFGSKRWAPP
jgi:hypothetical protein